MDKKGKKSGDGWRRKIALRDEDVMELFGYSKSTLGRLRKNLEIPHSQVVGSYFYHPRSRFALITEIHTHHILDGG